MSDKRKRFQINGQGWRWQDAEGGVFVKPSPHLEDYVVYIPTPLFQGQPITNATVKELMRKFSPPDAR